MPEGWHECHGEQCMLCSCRWRGALALSRPLPAHFSYIVALLHDIRPANKRPCAGCARARVSTCACALTCAFAGSRARSDAVTPNSCARSRHQDQVDIKIKSTSRSSRHQDQVDIKIKSTSSRHQVDIKSTSSRA